MNKREMNSERIQEVHRLIEAERNIIISRYVSVGKLYDLKYSEQAEDDFLPLINAIRDSEDKIKEFEEELLVLRGMVRCAACGAEVEEENTFCTKCGARIKEEPEPAPVMKVEDFDDHSVTVKNINGVFTVEADWLLQVMKGINFDDYESLSYFQKVLDNGGVIEALRQKGAEDGDTVSIYDVEFDFME